MHAMSPALCVIQPCVTCCGKKKKKKKKKEPDVDMTCIHSSIAPTAGDDFTFASALGRFTMVLSASVRGSLDCVCRCLPTTRDYFVEKGAGYSTVSSLIRRLQLRVRRDKSTFTSVCVMSGRTCNLLLTRCTQGAGGFS